MPDESVETRVAVLEAKHETLEATLTAAVNKLADGLDSLRNVFIGLLVMVAGGAIATAIDIALRIK